MEHRRGIVMRVSPIMLPVNGDYMRSIFELLGSRVERHWSYRDITVFYRPDLDGGGRHMSYFFVNHISKQIANGHRYRHVFEWCSGPGFIGFALLAQGLCQRICLADVNADAIACARKTAEENGLLDKVDLFVSDNLTSVPSDLRFDLVVSNPPNYYGLNPRHPVYAKMSEIGRAHV